MVYYSAIKKLFASFVLAFIRDEDRPLAAWPN